ncbi:MAG: hypothetical protein PHV36_04320 [Elusimicrobiales bacterium]|nr:hypothetical protein [Elusimicrobiales bacterium]
MKETWSATALLFAVLLILSFIVYRDLARTGTSAAAPPKRFDFIMQTAPGAPGGGPGYGLSGSTDPASAAREERERRIAAAVAKYGSRPVVLEFMEDLKKDPCTSKVIEEEKITDMVGALSAARRAGCLDKLKVKYAFRPQFIKLMAEVMADPEVRPLLESAPEEQPAAAAETAPPAGPAAPEPAIPGAP